MYSFTLVPLLKRAMEVNRSCRSLLKEQLVKMSGSLFSNFWTQEQFDHYESESCIFRAWLIQWGCKKISVLFKIHRSSRSFKKGSWANRFHRSFKKSKKEWFAHLKKRKCYLLFFVKKLAICMKNQRAYSQPWWRHNADITFQLL